MTKLWWHPKAVFTTYKFSLLSDKQVSVWNGTSVILLVDDLPNDSDITWRIYAINYLVGFRCNPMAIRGRTDYLHVQVTVRAGGQASEYSQWRGVNSFHKEHPEIQVKPQLQDQIYGGPMPTSYESHTEVSYTLGWWGSERE